MKYDGNIDSIYTYDAYHIDGLVQDCSNSSALAMGLLQSCTKTSIWNMTSLWMIQAQDSN